MIIEAFLQWLETARTNERVRAAEALASAWRRPELVGRDRQSARLAMTCLLDDRSPRVRLALARSVADDPDAPRDVILSLAHDQAEIAHTIISTSDVLTDSDLVELAARGDDHSAAMVAARPGLSGVVAAAIAEVGDEASAIILLENPTAVLGRGCLVRLVERHGHCSEVRMLLHERADLPAEARHLLVDRIGEALATSDLVRNIVGDRLAERVRREAGEAAVIDVAAGADGQDLDRFVDHLRTHGKLTPAFLIQALCRGRIAFFAAAIVNLSGLSERRVVSLIGDGRFHAIRALYESAGLERDIAHVFVEATLIWRKERDRLVAGSGDGLFGLLAQRYSRPGDREGAVGALLDMVERLDIAERRQIARTVSRQIGLAAIPDAA